IVIADKEGSEKLAAVDFVLVAWKRVPNNELYKELFGKVPELNILGDAKDPRTCWYGVHEAASIALGL
ncbi:MAG: hypothetical protein HY730_02780, partial [Candidatus Tectomicrobia bacterium]|nr:hypothetical protein [Candidatus Tectomicrobia bacterium]